MILGCLCLAADYRAPAGERAALRRPGAESVLPGGRLIAPFGLHHPAGPGAFAIAVTPKKNAVVAASIDQGALTLTHLSQGRRGWAAKTQALKQGIYSPNARMIFQDGPVLAISGSILLHIGSRSAKLLPEEPPVLAFFDSRRQTFSVPLPFKPLHLAVTAEGAYVAGENRVAYVADRKIQRTISIGESLSAITAANDRIYLSDHQRDSIHVLGSATLEPITEIPLRIPTLEHFRGILPEGLLYHADSGWLLVAESGINALAVIDTATNQILGHIPTAWFPTSLTATTDEIFLISKLGQGAGPNASRRGPELNNPRSLISRFALPDVSELAELTKRVYANNGFFPRPQLPPALPAAIEHVVLIMKGSRSFDDILGDIQFAENGKVAGLPLLARYGTRGIVRPARDQLQTRLALRDIDVTPNHHAITQRWAFSDNYYTTPDVSLPPYLEHLRRHLSIYSFRIEETASDQARASRFITELKQLATLPRFTLLHLPNDSTTRPSPGDGYPFPASYVADNDLALGRVLEFLTHSPAWPKMAVFITQEDTAGGLDHIDSHRAPLLIASPHAKPNYVCRANTALPSLMKTIFRLLGIPPMALADATASDLSDCFQQEAVLEPIEALPSNPEIFSPH